MDQYQNHKRQHPISGIDQAHGHRVTRKALATEPQQQKRQSTKDQNHQRRHIYADPDKQAEQEQPGDLAYLGTTGILFPM